MASTLSFIRTPKSGMRHARVDTKCGIPCHHALAAPRRCKTQGPTLPWPLAAKSTPPFRQAPSTTFSTMELRHSATGQQPAAMVEQLRGSAAVIAIGASTWRCEPSTLTIARTIAPPQTQTQAQAVEPALGITAHPEAHAQS